MNLERDETLEQRLERLGAGTAALRPRGGFNDRVMQAARASRPGVFDAVLRSARAVVPMALMAAVLATGWAVRTDHAADQALASSFDVMELEW